MNETNLLQTIRLGISDIAIIWRNNTGVYAGWDVIKKALGFLAKGNVRDCIAYLRQARPIQGGLCVGSSDLIGLRKSDGRMVAIEVKIPGKNPTPEQEKFISAISRNGGLAGVARSVEDARKIILGQ